MKLKQTIVQRILDGNSSLSLELAKELKVSQYWIKMLALKNKTNGPLTTAGALAVIKNEMKLADDTEILERENDSVAA